MDAPPRDSVRVLLILLVTVVACVFVTPLVAAQQHSSVSSGLSATSSSVTAVESSDSGMISSGVSTQTESIRISVTDSSNGQDNTSVGITVGSSTPSEMPAEISDEVNSTQWSTIVGDDNGASGN